MPSYIVIVSPSYGGAEKRFFDIFTALRRRGADVALIAPSSLVERYRADHPERMDVLAALIPIALDQWNPRGFVLGMRRLLRQLPRNASFHYPLNCLWPLHIGRGDRITMSHVDCTRVPTSVSRRLIDMWEWLSFFFAAHIDVLSPDVYAALRRHRARRRMSLTPGGTFMLPPPPVRTKKAPSVVLMSRLAPRKGVEELLDALPELWIRLQGQIPPDFSVQVAGYGVLEEQVKARIARLSSDGVPVRFLGYADAESLLTDASIVLSMQEVTNFPSRVVAEAMMAGCGVIVRDTGDSRQFGSDLPGLHYCKADLDPSELADQIVSLIGRFDSEPSFRGEIRTAAETKFSSASYIDYFSTLITGACYGVSKK